MLRTRVRKIGSGIGALALVAGFAGGAAGVAIGASALTATVAGASGHTYTCTVTDTTHHATASYSATYTVTTGLSVAGTVDVATPTDAFNVKCTHLKATAGVLGVDISGLALFAAAHGITETTLIKYVTFGAVTLNWKANASGDFTSTTHHQASKKASVNYHDSTPNVTCPVNQAAANVGAISCAFVIVSTALSAPKVDAVFRVHYAGDKDPQTPHIAITQFTVSATTTTTVNVSTTSGYWWGASNAGTVPAATVSVPPATTYPVPNPSVLITGHTITTVGTTGSDTLGVTPAKFTYTTSHTPGGTFTDPILGNFTGHTTPTVCTSVKTAAPTTSKSHTTCKPTYTPHYTASHATVVLPKGMSPGEHTLTVSEISVGGATHGTWVAEPITASTTFYVPGRAVTATSGAVPVGQIGPTTGFKIGPTKGWDPDSDSHFSGYWIPPATCTAAPAHVTASSLQATPTHPSTVTGTETFHFNTSDVAAYFSTATCVGGAHDQWTIHVNQHVTDPATVTATFGPITLVNLASTCHITFRSNNATPTHTSAKPTCLVQQAIGQKVVGTTLLVTEYAATTGINAPTGNPSPIQVNLEKVTLGPGVFQAGQGMLNTVVVNDSRGSLSGWTVTGVLTSDFHGPIVGFDHTIPADYLTWNPSVSLTFPGNLQATVVPDGTKSPPVYAPDSCHHGTSAHLNGGSNANVKCPTLATVHGLKSNDSAGTTNPAGKTNRTTSPSNHAHVEPWPSATAEGPSGLLYEVKAGPVANMGTSTTGAPDYSARGPQLLCKATSGGGGGSFNCTASLSLAVPPYIAAGSYNATMDILTVAS